MNPEMFIIFSLSQSDALDMHMAIGILRLPEGMDYSKYAPHLEKLAKLSKKERKVHVKMTPDMKKDDEGMCRNKSCSEFSEGIFLNNMLYNVL